MNKYSENNPVVDVAVALPFWQALTYQVPCDLVCLIKPLTRLVVPVRGRNTLGFALSEPEQRDQAGLKPISDVLDDVAQGGLWPPKMLNFFQRAASYYQAPLGLVLAQSLPAGLGNIKPLSAKIPKTKEMALVSLRENVCAPFPKKGTKADWLLTYLKENGQTPLPFLRKLYPRASSLVKKLESMGWVSLSHLPLVTDLTGNPLYPEPKPDELSPEQQKAMDELGPCLDSCEFKPFLIHGVTGSGKTELYLACCEKVLAQDKTALILTPEIGLCLRLQGLLTSRFPNENVAVLHSGLTSAQRRAQWIAISQGKARLVVGARSAVFAPLSDLGVICVDEEQDEAYKQEDRWRYHARDLALLRGQEEKCPVVLGTATPCVTTYMRAYNHDIGLIKLTKRVKQAPLPKMEVVDLKKAGRLAGGFLSPRLHKELRKTVENGNQALLFLNRRGFAPAFFCPDCGKPVGCPACSLSLTFHRDSLSLKCHTCGFERPLPAKCPTCGAKGENMKPLGLGTEAVAHRLAELEPNMRIARLDRDTASDHRKLSALLKQILAHEVDVIIGTQMISKGHHFPKLKLVGVLLADQALSLPDFRAGERSFTLLSQVAGRAGREGEQGRVIIQTYDPYHHAVRAVLNLRDQDFYEEEMEERRLLSYPPFSRLVSLKLEGPFENKVAEAAGNLGEKLVSAQKQIQEQTQILGPAPACVARVRGNYRFMILLKAPKASIAAKIMRLALHKAQPMPSKVRLTIDVDPVNLF